jgi:hypothetical protein
MKTINLQTMSRIDHPDVREQNGEANRKRQRMRIIKAFMKWQGKNKEIFLNLSPHSEEKIAINRQTMYFRLLTGLGLVGNFFFYQAIFTGTYTYRNRELLRMRSVPFPVKLVVSGAITGYMAKLLYNDSLYEEELYRVACKYRP